MNSLSSGTPRARLLSQALSFHFDAHTCEALDAVTGLGLGLPVFSHDGMS